MVLLAFITDPPVVKRILAHLGLPTKPPRLHPAHSLDAAQGQWDYPRARVMTRAIHTLGSNDDSCAARWPRRWPDSATLGPRRKHLEIDL